MEKQRSKLQAIFDGAKPTVPVFEAYLNTLGDYLRYFHPDPEAILQLAGKIEIWGDDQEDVPLRLRK